MQFYLSKICRLFFIYLTFSYSCTNFNEWSKKIWNNNTNGFVLTNIDLHIYRGDPDKADLFGNTALHLAAAQGHKHIVTFLVNFGANIYSTDVDGRTAQELAGINNREDILRYIDGVHAKLEAQDKKKVKAMQEKAKEDAKKRIKVGRWEICMTKSNNHNLNFI